MPVKLTITGKPELRTVQQRKGGKIPYLVINEVTLVLSRGKYKESSPISPGSEKIPYEERAGNVEFPLVSENERAYYDLLLKELDSTQGEFVRLVARGTLEIFAEEEKPNKVPPSTK